MFFIEEGNTYRISDREQDAVARIEPPCVMENGEEHEIALLRSGDGVWQYQGVRDRVTVTVEQKNAGLFYIQRNWTNISDWSRKIKTVFRITACFDVQRYLIPCVNINGNEFGRGKEPKGLICEGEKWVFAYDRVSIPSCTLTENRAHALSLFASSESDTSLVSSCSIWKDDDGTFHQEILHPAFESPVTYIDRDKYGDATDNWITLKAGESFAVGIYVLLSKPRWENYGICDTLDAALELFPGKEEKQCPPLEEIWKNTITFAQSLVTDCKGKKGFIGGFVLNENGEFAYTTNNSFQLAWTGQNVLLCRMFIEDYLQSGDKAKLDTALEILDTRVKYCIAPNGLLLSQLRDCDDIGNTASDTCNMGHGAYEFLLAWQTLRDAGIDKPEYLKAGVGLCDFFCEHYSSAYGFGKKWRHDGMCLDTDGTIGAFLIPPLAKAYEITQDCKYLETAEKAMEYYARRDLDRFCCTAGALDTCCVDKETSAPFIISAVLLYKLTHKNTYIEYGKKAAYYFASWMFYYQPVYSSDTDIVKLGVTVRGLTSVSAQHHHLDMYAGLIVPYLWELSEITGDSVFAKQADAMFGAILQFIGDGDLVIHGKRRPVGSQNEAVFHCNWGSTHRIWGSNGREIRGALNNWLVAWPAAFRLFAISNRFAVANGRRL